MPLDWRYIADALNKPVDSKVSRVGDSGRRRSTRKQFALILTLLRQRLVQATNQPETRPRFSSSNYNLSMPDAIPRLNQLLTESGHPPLDPETTEGFAAYLALLLKWNAKTNLTAIRDEEGILSRHFLESILCADKLPKNIVSLLDFGSGAGFPGVPIALMRKDISVTLAESQNKKAAFLRETIRTLSLKTAVHSDRAETLKSTFDCVTLRAVDNMTQAIPAAIQLLKLNGYLAILTTQEDASKVQNLASGVASFDWHPLHPLLPNTNRVLLLGQRAFAPLAP